MLLHVVLQCFLKSWEKALGILFAKVILGEEHLFHICHSWRLCTGWCIIGLRTEWASADGPVIFNMTLAIIYHVIPPTHNRPIKWNAKCLPYQHLMGKRCSGIFLQGKQKSNHVPCSLELSAQDQICFSPPRFIGIYKEAHPVWYLEGAVEQGRII